MIKAVVKHKYVKGAQGKAKGWAHIRYIEHRSMNEERENGPRRFFDEAREGIRGSEIKRSLDKQERYVLGATKIGRS